MVGLHQVVTFTLQARLSLLCIGNPAFGHFLDIALMPALSSSVIVVIIMVVVIIVVVVYAIAASTAVAK